MQPLRLTFREKVDVCWQKQLRDKYLSEGVPPVPHLDLARAVVRPVSRKLAEQIILKYEWLGTMSPTSHHYVVFFGSHCAGVCCFGFSAGANLNAYKEFSLLDYNELAYLARGANVHWSPNGTNSKLVAWACKLIARETKARLVIAYSDVDAGEIGTIYQASNWIYIGKGSSTNQWVSPSGRIFDQKYPSDLRRRDGKIVPRAKYTEALRENGFTEQKSNPKHRYVFVLDKSDKQLIQRVEAMRKPYPKRVTGEIDNAPGTNPETEDASSIVTL